MDVYVIRIWRSPDPLFCPKLFGVLDELSCQEDGGAARPGAMEDVLKVLGATPSRRLVFDGMDQFRRVLNIAGLTRETDP